MPDLNPKIVYNKYRKGEIDKTSVINFLISIIEYPQENYPITTDKAYHARRTQNIQFRIEAVKILGEIGIKSKKFFDLLENIVISEGSGLIFTPAVKILIENFPDKCIEPLRWVTQNTHSTQNLAIIFDFVWWSDNPVFSDLKNELYNRLGNLIQKHADKDLILEETIVLTLIEQFSHDFEKINYDQNTDEVLRFRDLYCIYKTNQDGHVIEIHLAPYGLTYVPESISKLEYLKIFSSIGGELFELPESIGQLHHLEVLDLLGNRLKKLPESIGDLKCLKKLMVESNNLHSLPNSIGRLKSLIELSAHSNKIADIPESIGKLESLKILNLGSNKIEYIPHNILSLKNLEILDLAGNIIKNKPEFIQSLRSITKLIM